MPRQIVQGCNLSLLQSVFLNISQISDKPKNKEREGCQKQDQNSRSRRMEDMLEQARSNILQLLAWAEAVSVETVANDAFSVRQWWGSVGGAVFIFVCLFKSPEEIYIKRARARGHVPSVNRSSDEDEDDDDDDNNIHFEGYKQHRSDATHQTLGFPFVRSPEELHKWRIRKRRWDNVAALEEEGVSVMESLTHQRRGDDEWWWLWCIGGDQRRIINETGKVFFVDLAAHSSGS